MRSSLGGSGQAVIEVLLILPVFLSLVFLIMEIGHLSFRTILIHHAAYEVARVGSLTTSPDHANSNCQFPHLNANAMQRVQRRILPHARIHPQPLIQRTLVDPQDNCPNYDVVVNMEEDVPLVFVPITGIFLGHNCNGQKSLQYRCLRATVRMPIERPLFK